MPWKLVNDRYDDGGISGGTLERPALQRLLSDIDAGRIDMVVVYKIDRLTRSLADFARLVERFDAANCSFVSVTQAFNTSSSMGRLTLNVLLSFAQFEREVTAERIRDKIAASKKKGLWMGGRVPLGFTRNPDPTVRVLNVDPQEAKTVQRLFRLYDELECVNAVARAAKAEGLRSKLHVEADGTSKGGRIFSRGQIYYLLRNPIYAGKIRHRLLVHEGQHEAIIPSEVFDRVQRKLQDNAARPRQMQSDTPNTPAESSPMVGKLFDETGDRLTPSHASKSGKRHRYYVSRRLITGTRNPNDRSGWRLPAKPLEEQIAGLATEHIVTCAERHELLHKTDAAGACVLMERAAALKKTGAGQIAAVQSLLQRCIISPGNIKIILDCGTLAKALDLQEHEIAETALTFTSPFQLRKRGVEAKITTNLSLPHPDAKLIEVVAKAHNWRERLFSGQSIVEIATTEGMPEHYIRTRIELAFLAPKIQKQILSGTQSADLSLERLINSDMPMDWREQLAKFAV